MQKISRPFLITGGILSIIAGLAVLGLFVYAFCIFPQNIMDTEAVNDFETTIQIVLKGCLFLVIALCSIFAIVAGAIAIARNKTDPELFSIKKALIIELCIINFLLACGAIFCGIWLKIVYLIGLFVVFAISILFLVIDLARNKNLKKDKVQDASISALIAQNKELQQKILQITQSQKEIIEEKNQEELAIMGGFVPYVSKPITVDDFTQGKIVAPQYQNAFSDTKVIEPTKPALVAVKSTKKPKLPLKKVEEVKQDKPVVVKKVGRPKKEVVTNLEPAKKRGRPKKDTTQEVKTVKKVGRPKKEIVQSVEPAKKRGRPKKESK